MICRARFLLVHVIVAAMVSACARDSIVAPSGAAARGVSIAASVQQVAGQATATFDRARIVFRRLSGATALDTTVSVAGGNSATLNFAVPLSSGAGAAGEIVTLTIACMSAAGDTTYRGGPVPVFLSPYIASPPVNVLLLPTSVPTIPLDSLPTVVDSLPAVVDSAIATTISAIGGDGQSGLVGALLGTPLTVLVADQHGKPMPAAIVHWAVAAGGGVLASASSITNAAGLATNTLRLGLIPGLNQVSATVSGLPSAIFTLTAALLPGSNVTAPSPSPSSSGPSSPASRRIPASSRPAPH